MSVSFSHLCFRWALLKDVPSPRDFVREDTSQKRADDGCNAVRRSHDSKHRWPFLRRCAQTDNGKCTGCNTGTSNTSDGTTNNQGDRIRRDGADETADFEDEHGNHEVELQGEVLVYLSPCGLKPTYEDRCQRLDQWPRRFHRKL